MSPSSYFLPQITLTQDNLDTVTETMRNVVQEASATEDQSSENLEAIVDVFTDIAESGGVVLDETVSLVAKVQWNPSIRTL